MGKTRRERKAKSTSSQPVWWRLTGVALIGLDVVAVAFAGWCLQSHAWINAGIWFAISTGWLVLVKVMDICLNRRWTRSNEVAREKETGEAVRAVLKIIQEAMFPADPDSKEGRAALFAMLNNRMHLVARTDNKMSTKTWKSGHGLVGRIIRDPTFIVVRDLQDISDIKDFRGMSSDSPKFNDVLEVMKKTYLVGSDGGTIPEQAEALETLSELSLLARSYYCAPIRHEGKLVGVLMLDSVKPSAEKDVEVVQEVLSCFAKLVASEDWDAMQRLVKEELCAADSGEMEAA